MEKNSYKEIASGAINENKMLVISECSKGGFALAQKIFVDDSGKKRGMFLKGIIMLDDIDSLKNAKVAFEKAIEILENKHS